MESHPLVNKVIVSVGSRRGEGQAASSKKKEKKQAQREEDREGEKKKETGTTETTAYLQLTGLAQELPLARHHREQKELVEFVV